MEEYFPEYQHQQGEVKTYLQNTIRMITRNYFGYLFNMESRGKAELKWFLSGFKPALGDLFTAELQNMEKQMRFWLIILLLLLFAILIFKIIRI